MKLSAQTIRRYSTPTPGWPPGAALIAPFHERSKAHGRSYGLSAAGYDVRLARGMWVWPLWGRLGVTIERFNMPIDLSAEVKDKSTNARRFITVQNTVIEPGWRGHLTLEITRGLPWPVYLPAGLPIAQIRFEPLDCPTDQPYENDDKYQDAGPAPQKAIMAKATA